ncbi:MAG: hypothetical protein Tsb0020_45070 [Haliangiales bacterium]
MLRLDLARTTGLALALCLGASSARAQPAPPEPPPPQETPAPTEPAPTPPEPADVFAELPITAGGLTATAAAARAVEVAPQVRSAEAASEQAREAFRIGKVAFAPRLDLRASYTRLSEIDQVPFALPPELGGGQLDLFPQILNNYLLRATVSVPLTDYFLTTLPAYRAGDEAATLAAHQRDVQREMAALRAREAFYNHVRVRTSELVVRDAVATLEAHIADLEALVAAGQVTRADLMQARAQLAEAQAQAAASRGAIRVTADILRVLLDLPADAEIAIGEDVLRDLPTSAPDPRALHQAALSERADVQALRALIRVNQHTVEAQEGARWPRLSVVGNFDYARPNQRVIPQEDQFRGSWDVSAVLAWSPNDYVTRGVEVDRANLEVIQARANLEALGDQIAIQASQAASDMQIALENLESTRQGVEAAREAWRVRSDLLGAGEATPSDVLDAEAALRRAQLAQIDAHIAVLLAHVQVQYVTGHATSQP